MDSVSKVSCLVSESMNTDNKAGRDVTISSSINVLDRNAPPEVYFWTGIIEGKVVHQSHLSFTTLGFLKVPNAVNER